MNRTFRRSRRAPFQRSAQAVCTTLAAVASAASGCTRDDANEPAHRAEMAMDGAWISLSGKVVSTTDSTFALDYGSGRITVEMDDWDDFPEARQLFEGDEVVVYGLVDDDFYERRTIEASSVYVKNLGKQFFASSLDEESIIPYVSVELNPQVEMKGTITSIDGQHFIMETGAGDIQVETQSMRYDPLDDEGVQRLEVGDRVRVLGRLDEELFKRDLNAQAIVILQSGRKLNAPASSAS